MLAFSPAVGVNIVPVFASQVLPPMQTSKQKAALIICQGAVEDPPWAAVQHASSLGKIRICTYHKLERVQHYNDVQLRIKSND